LFILTPALCQKRSIDTLCLEDEKKKARSATDRKDKSLPKPKPVIQTAKAAEENRTKNEIRLMSAARNIIAVVTNAHIQFSLQPTCKSVCFQVKSRTDRCCKKPSFMKSAAENEASHSTEVLAMQVTVQKVEAAARHEVETAQQSINRTMRAEAVWQQKAEAAPQTAVATRLEAEVARQEAEAGRHDKENEAPSLVERAAPSEGDFSVPAAHELEGIELTGL
jgi:hypothetical protein